MTSGDTGTTEAGPDPRGRFSGAAEGHARFRPGYPGALVDWMLKEAKVREGDPVAHLGCGTGILTRLLAARGLQVIGLDPNEDMLARARASGGGAVFDRAPAEIRVGVAAG